MTDRKAHWETIHATKGDEVSWYQPASTESARLIRACGLAPGASVLDVGAGASVLVDELLDLGHRPTLLEIAEPAFVRVRERLGGRASAVQFVIGDITEVELPAAAYDLWHDRAVFHFLAEPEQRRAYVKALQQALKPGGFVVLAGFAPDGPEKCSGLPVCRYDAQGFAAQLGGGFELLESSRELHLTPFGTTQAFQYTRFRRL
ncbi:class I SAM-dependent methyltransferase [Geothrix fermentans]|uniref:class I SAM-dependent methyltransferase n=1 Tax=Geothrix fermentans TaxID=44676 RepID=UPI0004143E75|nr:class I SAM-dependent methyltransferase [Geothrix fermentans]